MKPWFASLAAPAVGLALLAFSPGTARAQTLERKPYLQKTSTSAVTVVWTTLESSESVVRYGSSPSSLTQTANGAAGTQHEVTLTGLSTATRYYYSVGTASTTLAGGDVDHHFVTAPAVGSTTKFRGWVVGDSGTGGSSQAMVRDAMLTAVGAYRPQIFLHMGDMAYSDGTTSEFTGRFFGMYEPILRNTVTWPTMGNHEGHSSDSGGQTGPYYTAYVLPKAAEAGGLPSGTEAYYSFDWANVHFIVLDSHDSDRSPTGPMLTWAKNDLAATTQDWVIAFWHHPPYSKGTHDSDSEGQLIDMRENALPLLEAGGVDLVLGGHSHIYERSFLVDGAYATPTTAAGHIKDPGDGKPAGSGPYQKGVGLSANGGAVYVVAGHGGASLGGSGNHPLMYFSETVFGSCILDVQSNRLSMFNLRQDGQITDRFTLVKGSPALVIATPDGGEVLVPGSAATIQWATVGTVPNVKLEYSTDDGSSWNLIVDSVANTGSHSWNVPAVATSQGLVRVTSTTDAQVTDESNAGFSIGGGAPQTVIPFGDVWKYQDTGTDLGAGWTDVAYDDGSWPSGPAQLGYGDGDEATLLADADPNHPSAYFRKAIDLAAPVTEATLKVLHDDGVAVWVNGTEVLKQYVTTTDFASFASQGSQDNEVTSASIPLGPNPFVVGTNVIAAMVKQQSASSSDLSFDLELAVTLQGGGGAGGSGGAGTGAAAGTGGTSSGGASGSGTGGNGGAGGGAGTSGSSSDDGGCGCRVGRTPAGVLGLGALALAAFGLCRRRVAKSTRRRP